MSVSAGRGALPARSPIAADAAGDGGYKAAMTPEPPIPIESVFSAVARTGLVPRGAFRLGAQERVGLLAEVSTVALIGVAGRRGWDAFAASPEAHNGGGDPLDRFSRRVIDGLASEFAAVALYPFGGPPHWPFQQWARRAEPVHPSPIGLLIHPVYGLWHSFRGALGFREAMDLPDAASRPSACDACREKPCLSACPAGAFTEAGYDVPACAAHLGGAAGGGCMALGCAARRACPAGRAHTPGPEQASFAMRAFLRGVAATADCAP